MKNEPITPKACPKWTTCSAPVCPLDPNHAECQTLNGEAVCPWLREAVKADGDSRIPAEIAPTVRRVLPALLITGGAALRAKLRRAEQSASRMAPERPECYALREVPTAPDTTPPQSLAPPVRHTV